MARTAAKKPMAEAAPPAPVVETPANVPAVVDELEAMVLEDAGSGQENIRVEDLAIPRVYILQSNSPQCKKSDPKYIKDRGDGRPAEEGDFYNNVTGEVVPASKGLLVVPVFYRREITEWRPRGEGAGAGGGLVATHGDDEAIFAKTTKGGARGTKDVLANGNELVLTHEYYSFVVDPSTGLFYRAVLGFNSTQTKKARRWNTAINQLQVLRADGKGSFNPAMFYKSYLMTTAGESNAHGAWMGWVITPSKDTLALKNGKAIYLAARAFKQAVQAGAIKVAEDGERGSPDSHHGDAFDGRGDEPPPPEGDDEIPF